MSTDLAKRVNLACVSLHGVSHTLRPLLHETRVRLNGENFATESVELPGGCCAESAKADDEHWGVVCNPVNQRWAFLLLF